MVSIWKRPGLLAMELLWRWTVGIPILLLAARAAAGIHPNWPALQAVTVFKPAEAALTLSRELALLIPPFVRTLRWLVPVGLIAWTTSATLGQTAISRRLDPTLTPRPGTMAALKLLRSLALLLVLAVWMEGLASIARYTISLPVAAGVEPNLVLCTALAVGLTLLLFMLWSLTVWVLDAAPIFAMARGHGLTASLSATVRSGPLRSKLIETNLVMGIVKVCLLVLAMVFSASPLPFETVETQGFLRLWWAFVLALYLIASDLFHVIRRAAVLALFRALVAPSPDTTPAVPRAS